MAFKSIRTKLIVLVLSCTIASAFIIGWVCVSNCQRILHQDAARNMNLTCESYQYRYDAALKNAQSTVETAAVYASEHLDSVDRFTVDEAYRDEYASRLEDIMALEAMDTDTVMSYYVRFSPGLLSFEKGFRYVRDEQTGDFVRKEIVKIENYHETDGEYVSWYYEPIKNGSTTWLEPYYNANFDKELVSCVTPFYKDGVLAGVIGVDFDFSRLVADLDDLRVFDNGYAFLCSPEGKVYYHPLYEAGTFIQDDVKDFDADLSLETSGEKLFDGFSNGEPIFYAFRTLTNNMRLMLRAPVSEVEAEANAMMRTIIMITAAVVAVAVSITIYVCRRITQPLLELTVAATAIAKGDYSVPINVHTRDEVGVLAHTLRRASIELKATTARMNQLAYRDALVGVRNKTAYELEVVTLEQDIDNGTAEFGIAVFDVNNLKEANDTFGHEQGDKVIKTGCNRICESFAHSPVFRVGGDEFIALLSKNDMEHIDELLANFAARTEEENAAATRPQDVVTMAVGVAFYDPAHDSCVQDVFNRADAEMYANKQKMKSSAKKTDA